ncbi:MAG: hypothetical protein GWN76_03965 [candidate division Zixibacteria bacterium]|nr:hypothetical protein [Phycisphaerae bacterium]NIR63069.1 hypothetical protein [candidate division Zixibacteria bacterium]NIU13188.1 hypothetical protein [candidate division Zixibacteria bacterium]NIW43993.1 hypothetical protein [Gammaproteobacteria bacterium]NIW99463.1 hypothetical protein [Phycisphaerae bacterium]
MRFEQQIVERQDGLCICGYSLAGNVDIHEAIIKRGDLPGDKRVRCEYNCVAVHHTMPCILGGHIEYGNTKAYDKACINYLLWYYGCDKIVSWIESLGMIVLPGRAMEIINACKKFN